MSKIQWTQQTWNPIIGCSKISEGCANCYAERTAVRLARISATKHYRKVLKDGKWNGKTELIEPRLTIPLKTRKPTIFFVGSMTDLFHESVPFAWLDRIFSEIARCPQHRFILLTKRPERMQGYLSGSQREWAEKLQHSFWRDSGEAKALSIGWNIHDSIADRCLQPWLRVGWPMRNVILGVTAENQEQADKRIPILLDTPAAARFVSIEPMLGAVRLDLIKPETNVYWDALRNEYDDSKPGGRGPALDWVICGGESGPGARPMHPDWVRSLRDQCKDVGIPFFFKQWGEWRVAEREGQLVKIPYSLTGECRFISYDGSKASEGDFETAVLKYGKKKAGNILDGQTYEEYPEILREVQDA